MEIKKSNRANLEDERITGFLLGLILVLSVLFVSFEYTTNSSNGSELNEDLLDDISQDLEMMPQDNHDMVSYESAAAPSKTITTNIKKQEKVEMTPKKLSAISEAILNGVGNSDAAGHGTVEGAVKESDITTALPQTPASLDNPFNFQIVEQLPEFPGGMVEFMKWITKSLKYPPQAKNSKIQGEVVVSFIVDKEGNVSSIKIAKSVNPLLDREVLRVMHAMPKWKPGLMHNKPCMTMMAIPIVFSL